MLRFVKSKTVLQYATETWIIMTVYGHHDSGSANQRVLLPYFCSVFVIQLWFDRWWFGLFDSIWHRAHGYAGKMAFVACFLRPVSAVCLYSKTVLQQATEVWISMTVYGCIWSSWFWVCKSTGFVTLFLLRICDTTLIWPVMVWVVWLYMT